MPGERLVIIDDDPDVCEALTLILEPAGYAPTCCATGPEGIATIRDNPPDLILLDIMLASPSEGFRIASELRSDEALGSIPIIMISSIGAAMGMDYAKELGSDYVPVEKFLDKPLSAETILEAVKETLAGRADSTTP